MVSEWFPVEKLEKEMVQILQISHPLHRGHHGLPYSPNIVVVPMGVESP